MRPLNRGLLWTASCVLALGCSATVLAQDAQPTDNRRVESAQPKAAQSQPVSTDALPVAATAELPDSPGVTLARLQEEPAPQQSDSTQSSAPAAAQSSTEQNGTQERQQQPQQQQKLQRPVGTAAAAAPGVSGVTAAQPAGVAIAPAKQHRVRTIILRTGAILAGGAAIGSVIALTKATPSKPPGAH
jgi:hypothetical protein